MYPVPSPVKIFTKLVGRGTIFKGLRSILNEQAKKLKLELTGQFIIILELSFVFIHMGTLLSVCVCVCVGVHFNFWKIFVRNYLEKCKQPLREKHISDFKTSRSAQDGSKHLSTFGEAEARYSQGQPGYTVSFCLKSEPKPMTIKLTPKYLIVFWECREGGYLGV